MNQKGFLCIEKEHKVGLYHRLCLAQLLVMANVWGFPYKIGTNGGGAFLLIYIMFIGIFSYVGLSAEYAIGRRAKTGTLGSYSMRGK